MTLKLLGPTLTALGTESFTPIAFKLGFLYFFLGLPDILLLGAWYLLWKGNWDVLNPTDCILWQHEDSIEEGGSIIELSQLSLGYSIMVTSWTLVSTYLQFIIKVFSDIVEHGIHIVFIHVKNIYLKDFVLSLIAWRAHCWRNSRPRVFR